MAYSRGRFSRFQLLECGIRAFEMNPAETSEPKALPASAKRCWLHVGMHKTGTTSLQASLGSIRDHPQWKLLKIGGKTNMGPALFTMFAKNPRKHGLLRKIAKTDGELSKDGEALRQRLRNAVMNSTVPNLILSAESLSSAMGRKDLASLRDLLAPLCAEIRVIGYVRPPCAFKISFFQQAIKNGGNEFNPEGVPLSYRRRFKKFDDVFGRSKVLLRKFDPGSFPGGCIVADFCAQTGLDAPPPGSIRRTNESLCREACGMLYAYRKFGPGYGSGRMVVRENQRLIAPLYRIRGGRLLLSARWMKQGLAKERNDIRWIERRIGASLREDGVDSADAVGTEDELLHVSREACLAYAREFEKLHGMAVPPERIPAGDPVDPLHVAAYLEFCRGLIRAKLKESAPRPKNIHLARLRRFLRWLAGGPAASANRKHAIRPATDDGSSPPPAVD